MKLAPLLSQYLRTNKRLPLRGIGVFKSTPAAYVEVPTSKNAKIPTEDISFTNDPATAGDEDLVKFISAETGKMKALAISDLESYIELMQQFLNIGKPFQIEGIGTLVKAKQKTYEFTSGQLLNEKIMDSAVKELVSTSINDDSLGGYKELRPKRVQTAGFTLTKAFIAFLLFGGMVFAVWGGYKLYNKNRIVSTTEETQEKNIVPVETAVVPASAIQPAIDSTKKERHTSPTPGYKFVFETTHSKKRAIKRIGILKQINSNIQLETIDSSLFNITVNLIVPATDTTRVKDSLNNWYYGEKTMLVKIASPNAIANNP